MALLPNPFRLEGIKKKWDKGERYWMYGVPFFQ